MRSLSVPERTRRGSVPEIGLDFDSGTDAPPNSVSSADLNCRHAHLSELIV